MNNEEIKNDENEVKPGFNIIKLQANNSSKYIPLNSNYELDNYDYSEAIIYDNRNICRLFFIYFISKENILNIIFFNPPLELKPLRIYILIFNYALDFSLNAFFYLSDNISDKYNYKGHHRILFSLVNNLVISLASTLVCDILLMIFQSLTHSSDKIKKIFEEEETKMKDDKNYKVENNKKIEISIKIKKILKCLKVKILLFIIFELLFLLFFFYYVTAFCHVYNSAQSILLIDTVSSMVLGIIFNVGISLLGTICYLLAIKHKIKILYSLALKIY
jgi:hypothetical protein